ncbi:coiled-coil domain-containing protein 40 [Eublepharis macularius]|uniref:Coiled-coil domain-containing protein 40 n=1 Tax=Eublepharis macularius TaxID=481883 RepID=A0AA97KVV2_EUBMA|nr:coiled-coil domain-containing protein 40 [Eublepharis macularius]
MEPSRGTVSEHRQTGEDGDEELLATDEGDAPPEEPSGPNQEDGVATALEDSNTKDEGPEGVPTAAIEEVAEGVPTAVVEEGAEGAPIAAMEEGAEGVPTAAVEEGAEGVPTAAVEEGAEGVPTAAVVETAEGVPTAAVEEAAEGVPTAAVEEGAEGVPTAAVEEGAEGVPTAAVEEGAEGASMSAMEEKLPEEMDEPSTTGQSKGPSFVEEMVYRVSSEKIAMGRIPSRLYGEELAGISSVSSAASSRQSDLPPPVEVQKKPAAFPPYSESSLHLMTPQFSRSGPLNESEISCLVERDDEGSEEAEEEMQLVVLDPEHPLMKRFQTALKTYLSKQIEKLMEELREMAVLTKNRKTEREELGVTLYGVQQQLAQLQMDLEKNHSCHAQIAMVRRQLEEELQDLRNMYKKTCQSTEEERKKVSAMQAEMENLSLRLFYMQNMDQDVRDDIAVMKRTVKKAEVERMRAEVEKQKQDLHVDRLTRTANAFQEQIALYESQYIAQAEDTRITRKDVAEACTEIQSINLEKKQLLHQWAASLTGMKRRDEAYAAMQEALRETRHKLKSLEVEIEAYKKSISKEEERNELLASLLNRSENDGNTSRKLIAQSLAKQEAMKVELGTYTRTLQQTEQALNCTNGDRAARLNDLATLCREIEKGTQIKQDLENNIMVKLQDQLMSNKAAKYFLQLSAKLQNRMLDLDMQFTKIENDTAQTSLDLTNTNCRLNRLQKNLAELNKEMDDMNGQINHSESEIARHNLLIGRKQGIINLHNKKLETMISQLGGQELGPLELEIKKLSKQIDETDSDIVKRQRFWLNQQRELVKLSKEREEQLASLDMLKKEITIKEQKKVRIENEIQQDKNELKDIERHMKNMANDLEKLHMLINKNSASSEELQQGNTIMENEFVRTLKGAERESIELQEKLDQLLEEKERLINSLVETECQMMQWEKKIQIAKEMRAAVDSESGLGEIQAMKSEIHRMQVRYDQLKKQQEKMIRDMEAAVARRETIVIRGENQNRSNKQVLTKGDFYYKKQEMKKKIRETQKNAADCNRIIIELEGSQKKLSNALLEKQKQVSSLNAENDDLEMEIDHLQAKKLQNLSDTVGNQGRVKHMQLAKEGKYHPMCRTELMIRIERQKVESRLHGINIIVHQILQEYPQHHKLLQRLSQVLHSRMGTQTAV